MPPLTVTAETTPNPEAMKFTLNRTLFDERRGQTFASTDEALLSPLARALFALPGVAGVFLLRDFVTVRRQPAVEWSALAPAVQQTILAHYAETA